jgi:hypothetical protein
MALLGRCVVVGQQSDARQPADRLGGGKAVGTSHLFAYRERFPIQLFSARIVAQRNLGSRDAVHIVTQLDTGGRVGLRCDVQRALGRCRSLLHGAALVLQIGQGRQ